MKAPTLGRPPRSATPLSTGSIDSDQAALVAKVSKAIQHNMVEGYPIKRARVIEGLAAIGVKTTRQALAFIVDILCAEDALKEAADAIHPEITRNISAEDIAATTANWVGSVMVPCWSKLPTTQKLSHPKLL
jgi:hypothetical protein